MIQWIDIIPAKPVTVRPTAAKAAAEHVNAAKIVLDYSLRLQARIHVMSISPIMQKLAEKLQRTDLPEFAPGDTVRVQV